MQAGRNYSGLSDGQETQSGARAAGFQKTQEVKTLAGDLHRDWNN